MQGVAKILLDPNQRIKHTVGQGQYADMIGREKCGTSLTPRKFQYYG